MFQTIVTGVGSFSSLFGVRKNCIFGRQDTSI